MHFPVIVYVLVICLQNIIGLHTYMLNPEKKGHLPSTSCLQLQLVVSSLRKWQVKTCLLQSWESKAKHAGNEREAAQRQVSELQERLDAQGSSAQQSSQAIRAIELRAATLQRQMQVKVLLPRLQVQHAQSQGDAYVVWSPFFDGGMSL